MTKISARYAPGEFCWTELNSEDPEGSLAFYQGLFGWNTHSLAISEGERLTIFDVQGAEVAGLRRLHPLAKERGATTRWQSFLAVDDIEATLRKARELGATVLMDVHTQKESGRSALIQEPTGIVLALWEAGQDSGSALRDDEAGSVCWHDVYTADLGRGRSFFLGLFDYETDTVEMEEMELVNFQAKGSGAGKRFVMMEMQEGWRPGCQPFFSVVDAEATLNQAIALGAKVLCPVMDAGMGRFAHFQDPQGATFGILEWATP